MPGAGKSSAARRLAADLSLPFLSPDTVGQTLQASRGIRARDAVDAYWIAYDVLFRLCEEFVGAGLSVVLELNLGWAFQWDWLDRLAARQPGVRVLPIVLRCSRHIRLERIRQRHTGDPSTGAPELYETDCKILAVFDFLEQLQRPDVVAIDAGRPADEVYSAIRQAATAATRPVDEEHGWMPRTRWDALVRGEGCPLCAELSRPDRINAFGFPVGDLNLSRLRLAAKSSRQRLLRLDLLPARTRAVRVSSGGAATLLAGSDAGRARRRGGLRPDQNQLPDPRQSGAAPAHAYRAALLR